MKVLVTGATGFIGQAVVLRLLRDGHRVVATSRSPARARARLGASPDLMRLPSDADGFADCVSGCDAVVHLAGEPIATRRWTAKRKRALEESRVASTRALVEGMARAIDPPRVLVSASAIGIYGDRGSEVLSESSEPGDDFLARLCRNWEDAALSAREHGIRVVCPRIGIVLGRYGGALGKLMPLFKAGLGGRLGSGQQFMSWIHIDDLVEVLVAAATDSRFSGPINAVAPKAVSNREFTAVLAAKLKRRARLPVPAAAVKMRLGGGAAPILASQRVVPNRLAELNWRFDYPDLGAALAEICRRDESVVTEPVDEHTPIPDSPYLRRRRPRYVLRQRIRLRAPLNEVFEYFSRAENLGALTPPEMSFAIQTPTPIPMKVDQIIDYTIRLGPMPMRWRTVIAEWVPGSGFVDSQARGPYRSWWHEHRFVADGADTIIEDRILYAPPLGVLGRIAHRLFIAGTLRRIFSYRSYVVSRRFGTPPAETAQAA